MCDVNLSRNVRDFKWMKRQRHKFYLFKEKKTIKFLVKPKQFLASLKLLSHIRTLTLTKISYQNVPNVPSKYLESKNIFHTTWRFKFEAKFYLVQNVRGLSILMIYEAMNSSTPRFIMNVLASGNEDMWLAERKFVDFRSFYGQFISLFAVFDPERVKIWIYRRFWFIFAVKNIARKYLLSDISIHFSFSSLPDIYIDTLVKIQVCIFMNVLSIFMRHQLFICLTTLKKVFQTTFSRHNPITQCHPSLGNFFWWDILSNLKYLFFSWTKCYKTFWQNFIRTWRSE